MSNRAWRRRRSQWWTHHNGQWHALNPATSNGTRDRQRPRSNAHWTYVIRRQVKRYRKVLDAMPMNP